ncbi:mandelate racemase/muconate lactonizing enzyme family protein [Chitinophaga sp. MM2321]|uniref:mandelate racemase/muconate lactonizing enzyme family protein n=1 Tax=Chitinophaga sp. MM2321 TaxID=3137178 RepID=UPI0032D58BB3
MQHKTASQHTAFDRRSFLQLSRFGLLLPLLGPASLFANERSAVPTETVPGLLITGIDLHVVKVNARGDWYFIELKTNKGLTGLGECSHALSKQSSEGALKNTVQDFFQLIKGASPFNIEQYRQRGLPKATDKLTRTVFSGIEQALWDLSGKALEVPVYNLLGGKVRDKIRVYANINRASNQRDSNGRRAVDSFRENAALALQHGFKAVKLAPFDEMRPLKNATPQQVQEDIAYAIDCIEKVRATIGKDAELLVDVHSHLDVPLAKETARKLEPARLFWFEEPVAPGLYPAETKEIREAITQVLAGGESIFGREGYATLLNTQALGIIMPDVKHCGGLLECKYIAAQAETNGNIQVAPHNPSGPVATAATVAVCAGLPNFSIMEYAFNEVPWSSQLLTPTEKVEDGYITVPDRPGLGYELNYSELKKHIKSV